MIYLFLFLFAGAILTINSQTSNPPIGGSLDDLIGSVFSPGDGADGTGGGPQPDIGGNVNPNGGNVNPNGGNSIGIGIGTGNPNPNVGGGNLPNNNIDGGNIAGNFPNNIGGGNRPITGGGNFPNANIVNPCATGECVPYYQCANGSIITDGDGLIDIRLGEENMQTEAHPCTGVFETCCTLKSNEPIIPDQHIHEGCGYRNVEGVGFRITGDKDNESQFGEFPWTIAILKEEKALNKVLNVFQCGGSLIHPSVVLTAAHCVSGKDPLSLKVRAGEWDTQTTDEIFPHQNRDVAEYVIHEQYYKAGLFNDIALLFLTEPVNLAENVNTACLPPQDYNFDQNRCFASGWGKDLFGKEGKYQVILKRVELPIVPRANCLNQLRKTRLGSHFQLHGSFICAGGERGRDTCKGDGGSPLVCPIPGTINRYYQAGIVAWGIGCGDETPGVYVNVGVFRAWIDQQFRSRNINGGSYIYI